VWKNGNEDDSLYHDYPLISSTHAAAAADLQSQKDKTSGIHFKDQEVVFSGERKECCVCFIDIVNSTNTVKDLNPIQISKYYSIFLNSTAIIAKNFDATIIKNVGDCLIFYFPKTMLDGNDKEAFKAVVECGLTMISAHDIINSKLYSEYLPSLDYRISADYGAVEFAKFGSSEAQDIFGSAMNLCAKINSKAEPNGMVFGKNLYDLVNFFDEYLFEEIITKQHFSNTFDDELLENTFKQYAIYSVKSKYKKSILNPFTRTFENAFSKPPSQIITSKFNNYQAKEYGKLRISSDTYNDNIGPYNILLIDDEEDILVTFKNALEYAGHYIDTFTNSLKAFEKFEKDPYFYDIVITDIKMPHLNGLDLYNKIKTKNKNIKILFISALEAAEMLVSVLPEISTKNIIKKPIENQKLVERIYSIINNNNNGCGNQSYL
jgi:two-component system, OmpR family, response regulator ChvI